MIFNQSPKIAEELLLHHLQLAATMFELTDEISTEALDKKLDEMEIDNALRSVFASFIREMDSLCAEALPTPIPSFVADAVNGKMAQGEMVRIDNQDFYKVIYTEHELRNPWFKEDHRDEQGNIYGYIPVNGVLD